MKTYKVWLSGFVRRWHSNPDMAHTAQTNAQHQWGCAILALKLWPDDHALLIATITHDVGEVGIGDVSGLEKSKNPSLKRAIDASESSNFERLGLPQPEKTDRLKLVDMLEAYMWADRHAPHILNSDGWPEMKEYIFWLAERLRVSGCVSGIIGETS